MRKMICMRAALLACLLSLIATAACATGPRRPDASDYPRTPSYAISQSEGTSLGAALTGDVRGNPGKSGFYYLADGEESLRLRLAMVNAAEKTLDLQYYAMHDDPAANLVLEAIVRAAERGVRVRFLIDNIDFSDVERSLAILDSNKNIQVRVFNPIATKDQGLIGRINGLIVDFDKALKRMHNKAIIADNQLAIIGGRNIGDEYFDARPDANFKDTDLLTAGPITAWISASFDEYWNSEDSFPVHALHTAKYKARDVQELRAEMKAKWDERMHTPEGRELLHAELAKRLKDGAYRLLWAKAELSVDEPEKINQEADISLSKPLSRLVQLGRDAEEEFVAISAYFVPREEGVAMIKRLRDRGIRVRILTNSLASTDVVAVHTGYKRYRQDIVDMGVELYEYKPLEGERPGQRLFGSSAPPQASLHSKVMVIDRKIVVIGSYNLDPRSTEQNTELAVIIHSPQMARQVLEDFEETVDPKQSYMIVDKDGTLQWVTEEDGKMVTYGRDPGAGFLRNAEVMLFSLLPIEDQL